MSAIALIDEEQLSSAVTQSSFKSLYSEANKIIEGVRYQYGCGRFLNVFIQHWAFLHSGLYPSNEDIINEKEFEEAAIKLTHVLSELMIRYGESDPLSRLLSDFTTNSKDLSYFPTPDGVTKLLSALLGEEKLNSGNKHSMYEPTAGSGAIILQRIEDHFYANQHLDNPLDGVSILTEDISDLMCNSLFLQLVHKLQYLSSLAGRQVFPDQVRIASVDVLSRKKGRVYYEMSKYQ